MRTILTLLFAFALATNACSQSASAVFIAVTTEYKWPDGLTSMKGEVELVVGVDGDDYILWHESEKRYRLPRRFGQIITAEDAALRLIELRQHLYTEIAALTEKSGGSPKPGFPVASAQPVYISKTDDSKNNVVKLANGAVIEITRGILGFVGFRKDAVLYKAGKNWHVWIEGKGSRPCDILKAPENRPSGQAEAISISEVKGDGKILAALDGSLFEVGKLNVITTSLWLGPFEALLIDGTQLLNLESSGELIDVEKLK